MKTFTYPSPIGTLHLHYGQNCFDRVIFIDDLSTTTPQTTQLQKTEVLPSPYAADLNHYFQGELTTFDWPLNLTGTPFQIRVWQELRRIPFARVTTYKAIALALGTKGYQAVGSAIGANPLPLIIPCHRVLGTTDIGGYHYGLAVKRQLLTLEQGCQF